MPLGVLAAVKKNGVSILPATTIPLNVAGPPQLTPTIISVSRPSARYGVGST